MHRLGSTNDRAAGGRRRRRTRGVAVRGSQMTRLFCQKKRRQPLLPALAKGDEERGGCRDGHGGGDRRQRKKQLDKSWLRARVQAGRALAAGSSSSRCRFSSANKKAILRVLSRAKSRFRPALNLKDEMSHPEQIPIFALLHDLRISVVATKSRLMTLTTTEDDERVLWPQQCR